MIPKRDTACGSNAITAGVEISLKEKPAVSAPSTAAFKFTCGMVKVQKHNSDESSVV